MNRTLAEGAVILAPRGRDGAIARSMLIEGGLKADTVADLPHLVAALRSGAGFAILTEEALRSADLHALHDCLQDQADWSDFPFIVLTQRGGGLERNPGAVRLLEMLGNVTFLERPFHPTTLLSLARSALRARLRQYEARRRLEEIRDGEQRLTLALAAGGMGAWTLDLATMTLYASADGKAHFGRAANEPFGYADLLASIHEDDRSALQQAVARSIRDSEDHHSECRCIWPDGSLHWVQINGRPEVERNRAVRLVGVSHEITERKRAAQRQDALLALSDRLRLMTDADQMSFAAAEILGTTLQVSRAGYGIINPADETITVDRDWNMQGTESRAGMLHFRDYGSCIEDLKHGELVVIADAREDPRTAARAAGLEAIHARAFLNMPIVERGNFIALLYLNHAAARAWSAEEIAFVRDVADRTQAAMERRSAETSLAELAGSLERQVEDRTRERDRTWQTSQDLLIVVSEGGRFLAVNPAWTAILGWRPDELVGQNPLNFTHPDDTAGSHDAYGRARAEGLKPFENRIRHRDGSYRWISWVAASHEGHVYASGRHITLEKEARDQLETAQEQLRQAQKMEAVGQLTGGIAHDFNNLLMGISGSLELIRTRAEQGRFAEIERYLAMGQQATTRAAALTHRLLAFSRRQTLDPKPTNINRLVASLDDLLRRSVGPTIDLERVEEEGLWTTLIDPNQLENAVLNLCINARDAMPDGGRITIETANKWLDPATAEACDLKSGQYVSLSVTDTGTGMSPHTVERAFDPFFTTKPMGEGTGLGLSMIYGFVHQSGGQVRVTSELGSGTTMSLYFPRDYAEEEGEGHPQALDQSRIASDGETVLVVDDEPAIRTLVSDVLGELGYHAVEAGNGPEGLAILETGKRIDLLVTDVGLPKGMNGRQLADAARVTRPELKILFITGYAENAAIGTGRLDPGMHVLTKPFAMDALAHKIRDLIVS